MEGSLVRSPSPTANHVMAMGRLLLQLTPQAPPGYRDEPSATGAYVAPEPFPVRFELDQLR